MSQDSRSYVYSLLALPEYLTQMSLAQAAPVAERLFEIISEFLESDTFTPGTFEESISNSLGMLLLSHPHPSDILSFYVRKTMIFSLYEVFVDTFQGWSTLFFKSRDIDADDEDTYLESDEEPQPDWDTLYDYLPEDFCQNWHEAPEERLEVCLKHAGSLRDEAMYKSGKDSNYEDSNDFSRLEQVYRLLRIICDSEELKDEAPEDLHLSALFLLVWLSHGQSCWGRDVLELSQEKMLGILAENRPDMIQDQILSTALKTEAKQADPAFRKTLLQEAQSAIPQAESAWAMRVLDLAPAYDLQELIPELVSITLQDGDILGDQVQAFVEKVLFAYAFPAIWREYARQSGLTMPEQGTGADNASEDTHFAMYIAQKAPSSEAADWLEAWFDVLLEENEVELLEAVSTSGDQRFIPILQGILADGETWRKEVFQTLCLLHDDQRALGREEDEVIWKEREAQHDKARQATQGSYLKELFSSLDEKKYDFQCRCDRCQKVYNYQPERVVVHFPSDREQDMAVDIGGETLCKACGALPEHLHLTQRAMAQLKMILLPRMMGNVDARKDLDIGRQGTDPGRQIVTCPQETSCYGRRVGSMNECLGIYNRMLASEPASINLLVGKANILKRLLRLQEARSFYLQALEKDPQCLDALHELYQLDTDQGQDSDAFSWLQRAFEAVSSGTIVHSEPNEIKKAIVDQYAQQAPKFGYQPEVGTLRKKMRIGRNDPCPCGSGKKYKKCCLK
jgi:tetratricopeptide (TPR) repeat protein